MSFHKKETEKIELVAGPAGFFSSVEEAKDVLNDRRRREMFSYPTLPACVSIRFCLQLTYTTADEAEMESYGSL